jgi:hypothetical protein
LVIQGFLEEEFSSQKSVIGRMHPPVRNLQWEIRNKEKKLKRRDSEKCAEGEKR